MHMPRKDDYVTLHGLNSMLWPETTKLHNYFV